MTTEQIEEYIHAEEIMENAKLWLLPHYIDQYGSKYSKIIEERLKNTFYLTEDFPDVKYEFLKNHYNCFSSQEEYDNMVLEYFDYIEVNKRLVKQYNRSARWLLCDLYNVSKEVIDIDKNELIFNEKVIRGFSTFDVQLLENPSCGDKTKQAIKGLQFQYLKEGYAIGGKPEMNSEIIDDTLNTYSRLKNCYHADLMKQTLWGKRLINQLREKYDGVLNETDIINLLLNTVWNPSNMVCTSLEINGIEKRLIYFPILKNHTVDLNDNYYHEMRHAVETIPGKYQAINEIRVEKNATSDCSLLPKVYKFLGGGAGSFYSELEVLTNGLFDKYPHIFNEWAITNNPERLEKLFGYDNLTLYNSMIQNIIDLFLSGMSSDINVKSHLEQVDKMVKRLEKHLGVK